MSGHRSSEYRLVMTGAIAVCALGCASSVWPLVDQVMSWLVALLLTAVGLAACGWLIRRVREGGEDRADAMAARWFHTCDGAESHSPATTSARALGGGRRDG